MINSLANQRSELENIVKTNQKDQICMIVSDTIHAINVAVDGRSNTREEIVNLMHYVDQIMKEYQINGLMIYEIKQKKVLKQDDFEKEIKKFQRKIA